MLKEFLQKAVEMNADKIEVEYKDGQEFITALRGYHGFGIGTLPANSKESEELFEEIYTLKKTKRVEINGISYRASVSRYEDFGEWAYRINFTEVKKGKRTSTCES